MSNKHGGIFGREGNGVFDGRVMGCGPGSDEDDNIRTSFWCDHPDCDRRAMMIGEAGKDGNAFKPDGWLVLGEKCYCSAHREGYLPQSPPPKRSWVVRLWGWLFGKPAAAAPSPAPASRSEVILPGDAPSACMELPLGDFAMAPEDLPPEPDTPARRAKKILTSSVHQGGWYTEYQWVTEIAASATPGEVAVLLVRARAECDPSAPGPDDPPEDHTAQVLRFIYRGLDSYVARGVVPPETCRVRAFFDKRDGERAGWGYAIVDFVYSVQKAQSSGASAEDVVRGLTLEKSKEQLALMLEVLKSVTRISDVMTGRGMESNIKSPAMQLYMQQILDGLREFVASA